MIWFFLLFNIIYSSLLIFMKLVIDFIVVYIGKMIINGNVIMKVSCKMIRIKWIVKFSMLL